MNIIIITIILVGGYNPSETLNQPTIPKPLVGVAGRGLSNTTFHRGVVRRPARSRAPNDPTCDLRRG